MSATRYMHIAYRTSIITPNVSHNSWKSQKQITKRTMGLVHTRGAVELCSAQWTSPNEVIAYVHPGAMQASRFFSRKQVQASCKASTLRHQSMCSGDMHHVTSYSDWRHLALPLAHEYELRKIGWIDAEPSIRQLLERLGWCAHECLAHSHHRHTLKILIVTLACSNTREEVPVTYHHHIILRCTW